MAGRRHRIDDLAAVSAGGVIGASARYALSEMLPIAEGGIPVATLTANLVGSFVLGIFAVMSAGVVPSKRMLHPFLAVGVIGSFTTFSSFAVQSVVLVDQGDVLIALIYVLTTLVAGLAAARLGIGVARRIVGQTVIE